MLRLCLQTNKINIDGTMAQPKKSGRKKETTNNKAEHIINIFHQKVTDCKFVSMDSYAFVENTLLM